MGTRTKLAAWLAAVLLLCAGSATFAQQDDPKHGAKSPPQSEEPQRPLADFDGDHFAAPEDCNDNDPAIHPGATEVCNGVDDDCNGLADDGIPQPNTYYRDADGDGFGNPMNAFPECRNSPPSGLVTNDDDCNDSDAAIKPTAVEVCDAANVDEDCDTLADDADPSATGKSTWYADVDSDTFGDASTSTLACDQPPGFVSNSTDCNDGNAAIKPTATEVCDAGDVDEDCDGLRDDADLSATGQTPWYTDGDLDTFGNPLNAVSACNQPPGRVADNTDCDDSDPAINPGALEACDAGSVDEDCDGLADDADTGGATGKATWYADADSDTFGALSTSTLACDQPSGFVSNSADCNDGNAAIKPTATEVCDSGDVDEDCDGLADDDDLSATGQTAWYLDSDHDGFGNATASVMACNQPPGRVADATDCNDASDVSHPGALEICDGLDNDCDTAVDDATRFVRVGGDDASNDCSSLSAPCATIQHAVAQVCDGGVVDVGPGSFTGPVNVAKPITLKGAQYGVAAAGRTPGTGETVITGGVDGMITIAVGNVVVDGFEIVGGGPAHAGVVAYNDSVDLPGIQVRNNLIHDISFPNPYGMPSSIGVQVGTGPVGARHIVSGLVVTGNRIFNLGQPGVSAGRGVFAYTIQGGSAGAGATISGNTFSNFESQSASNAGIGVGIDVGNDAPPLPTPCTGVLVTNNTYSTMFGGVGIFGDDSSVDELGSSFTGVSMLVLNSGNFTTIDEAHLGKYARTDKVTGYPSSTGYFTTIGNALAFSDPGAGIDVTAGEFVEAVVVNKADIQLRGPNAGLPGNSGSRVAEAVILPPVIGPNISSAPTTLLTVSAAGVRVAGFTFDGNNPALTSGNVMNGVDVDAAVAIRNTGAITNLLVENNRFASFTYAAVNLDNALGGGNAASAGNVVRYNTFHNMDPYRPGYGIGVALETNAYAHIHHNQFTEVRKGVQVDNFFNPIPPSGLALIEDNVVSSTRAGIWDNLQYGASDWTIRNNSVTGLDPLNRGVWLTSLQLTVGATVTGNTVTGGGAGIAVWNVPTTGTITVTDNTVSGAQYGVRVSNNDYGANHDPGTSALTVSRLTATGCTVACAAAIDDADPGATQAVSLTVLDSTLDGDGTTTASIAALADGPFATLAVHTSTLTDAHDGALARNGAAADVSTNQIVANGTGVRNDNPSGTVLATCVWWGSVAGPGGSNGVGVLGSVNTSPFDIDTNFSNAQTYYADNDHDGFGNAATAQSTCGAPIGYVANGTDCMDTNAAVFPNAPELCDTIDNQCTGDLGYGSVDEGGVRYVAVGGSDTVTNAQGVSVSNDCLDRGPYGPCATIQRGIDIACNGETISVGAGSFVEDVAMTKTGQSLIGAGIDQTFVVGKKGGSSHALNLIASNLLVKGLTVTREGNNTTDWYSPTLNNFSLTVAGGSNNVVEDVKIWRNRNGLYIENTTGNRISRCVIDENRTGIHIVGNVSNTLVENCTVTNNQTFGVLYRGAANVPGVKLTNNSIHGNWEAQVEVRSDVAGPVFDLSGNWFGSATLDIVPTDRGEPGYDATNNIPVWAGGTVAPPVSLPEGKFTGALIARADYTPWLNAGTDTNVAPGFQGDFSYLHVDDDSAQAGTIGRVQEGVDLVAGTTKTIDVHAGTYTEQVVTSSSLLLKGAGRATTAIKMPAAEVTDPVTASQNILTVGGAGSSVEVTGLSFDGGPNTDAPNCSLLWYGVFARDGVALNFHDNEIRNIRNEPLSGCQWGIGIRYGAAYASTTATGTIANNIIREYQKGGIVVSNTGSSATIDNNTVSGVGPTAVIAQNGIQISAGATVTIQNGNVVTGHAYTPGTWASSGILAVASPGAVQISNTTLTGNDYGIDIESSASPMTVHQNTVTGSRWAGLAVEGASVVATENAFSGGELGVLVGSYDTATRDASVTLERNTITATLSGVQVYDDSGSFSPTVTAHYNSIAGNTNYGFENPTTNVMDARCNWWGDPAGSGAGDDVSANVTAVGWLLANDFGADSDGDGYDSCTSDLVGDMHFNDCNNALAAINPGATEVCDGIDNNCNLASDEGGNALCDDGFWCTGAETCGGVAGCLDGVDPNCDDSIACTTDSCSNSLAQCTHEAICSLGGHVYYNKVTGLTDGLDMSKPVDNVALALTGDASGTDTTDAGGEYSFGPIAGNVTLTPQPKLSVCGRCDTPVPESDFCALGASDATEIARYAVGLSGFSPNQLLIGDVSNNNRVTSFDASQVAQNANSCGTVTFAKRTATGSDWAFFPNAVNLAVTSTPVTTYSFTTALWGDVTNSWTHPATLLSEPVFQSPRAEDVLATITAARPGSGAHQGATVYIASGPTRNSDGSFDVVLGLMNADGIVAIDAGLLHDTAAVRIRNVRTTGLSAGFALEQNERGGEYTLALYGTRAMTGTGPFLEVTLDLEGAIAGLPFEIAAEANEGAIPLSIGPIAGPPAEANPGSGRATQVNH